MTSYHKDTVIDYNEKLWCWLVFDYLQILYNNKLLTRLNMVWKYLWQDYPMLYNTVKNYT